MNVTAVTLNGVHTDLSALAAALKRQDTSVRTAIRQVGYQVESAEDNWEGPRAQTTVTAATEYLAAVGPYPVALSSASQTLMRWARVALETAQSLALQEQLAAGPGAYADDEARAAQDDAETEIDLIRAEWARTCVVFAGQLDSSITAINKANAATAIPIDPKQAELLKAQLMLSDWSGPAATRSWWESLTDEEQLSLLAMYPGMVGNLDGIPARDRDIANRTQLLNDLNRLEELEMEGGLSHKDRRELKNVRNVLEQLENGDAYTDPVTGEPVPCQLYIYEPATFDGDGRVAISTGDLDNAAHIAVMVPGFTTNVAGMTNGDSQNLYDETRWASGDDVAVLNWQAYNTPDLGGSFNPLNGDLPDALGVTHDSLADAGAQQLASDVDGLNSIRDDDPHLTVIGHSYGSTTTSIAATDYGLEADDIVLLGSPGVGSDATSGDFPTGSDHTWAGSASDDPVSFLPGLGGDPAHEDFGGIRFDAENEHNGYDNLRDPLGVPTHTSYYDDESESLYNVSSVVAGEYDLVTHAPDRTDDPGILDISPGGHPALPGIPAFPNIDLDGPFDPPEDDPENGRDPQSGSTHEHDLNGALLPGP